MPVPSQTCERSVSVTGLRTHLKPSVAISRAIYLASEFLVDLYISLRAVECLLEESKQNRDNDDSLEGLSKDDEEDWHSKNLRRHGGTK